MRESNRQSCFEPCTQEEAQHHIAARNHTYFWARSPYGDVQLLVRPWLGEGWEFVRPIEAESKGDPERKAVEVRRELADQIECELMGEHCGTVRIDIANPSQRGW